MNRPIDADEFIRKICNICNAYYEDEPNEPCRPEDCFAMRAIKDTPTLTPQNEWVSVEERLPPNMDDVIKEFGITKSMFHDRKHKGWNLDEIASTPKNAIGGYRPKGVRVYHG